MLIWLNSCEFQKDFACFHCWTLNYYTNIVLQFYFIICYYLIRFLGVLCAYTEYYLNRLNEWCSQQPTRLSEIMQSELRLFLDPIPTVSSVLSRNKQISDPIENENITDVSSSPSQQTTVSQEISQRKRVLRMKFWIILWTVS